VLACAEEAVEFGITWMSQMGQTLRSQLNPTAPWHSCAGGGAVHSITNGYQRYQETLFGAVRAGLFCFVTFSVGNKQIELT
jgi:hypothetical protein